MKRSTYFFIIAAVSLVSLIFSNTYSQVSPAPPSNLTGVAIYSTQIRLNWEDNSDNETGFQIFKKENNNFVQIGSVGANVKIFYAVNLYPNTSYTFKVRAFNGAGYSLYSNEITVTTPANQDGTPYPPENLRVVSITDSSVEMSWDDRSNNEDGFKIAKRFGIDTSYIIIDSTISDVLTYKEVGLSPGSDNWYKVCAFNRYGNSSYTNTIYAHTTGKGGVGIINYSEILPDGFYIGENYPNPFNPVTNFRFGLPVNSNVRITIYDTGGREITTLLNRSLSAGTYTYSWSAGNLNSGIYYAKIDAASQNGIFTDVKKLMLIK